MPELSDREYDLLFAAINSNNTAMNGVLSAVSDLRVDLEKRFLTKDEDYRDDDAKFAAVRAYTDEARTEYDRRLLDAMEGVYRVIHVLQWVVGLEASLLVGAVVRAFLTGH